jgi:hypothetical protein
MGVYRLYLVMVTRVQALSFLPVKPARLPSSSLAVLAVAVSCELLHQRNYMVDCMNFIQMLMNCCG